MSRILSLSLAAILFFTSCAFAQSSDPSAVPNISGSGWALVDVDRQPLVPGIKGLDAVDKYYQNIALNKAVIITSLIIDDGQNSVEEELFMQYGATTDPEPWVALKINGKWYVSREQNVNMFFSSEILDKGGSAVGIRLSLYTKDGLKSRDIMFPK